MPFTAGAVTLCRERRQKIVLFLLMYVVKFFAALFVYTSEELAGHFNDSPALRQIPVYSITLPPSAATIRLLDLMRNRGKNSLPVRTLCPILQGNASGARHISVCGAMWLSASEICGCHCGIVTIPALFRSPLSDDRGVPVYTGWPAGLSVHFPFNSIMASRNSLASGGCQLFFR